MGLDAVVDRVGMFRWRHPGLARGTVRVIRRGDHLDHRLVSRRLGRLGAQAVLPAEEARLDVARGVHVGACLGVG